MAEKHIIATSGPEGSRLRTWIPWSAMSLTKADRLNPLFASLYPGIPAFGWMVEKSAKAALLAAAVAGGSRILQDVAERNGGDYASGPAKDSRKAISTTFTGRLSADEELDDEDEKKDGIGKKAGAESSEPIPYEVEQPPAIGSDGAWRRAAYIAIPTAATLLAAAAAWKGVDGIVDKHNNKVLSDSVDSRANDVRKLLMIRAKVAKGTATPEELEEARRIGASNASYVKKASESGDGDGDVNKYGVGDLAFGALDKLKGLFSGGTGKMVGTTAQAVSDWSTGLKLLALALAGATAVGSYEYFSAADPNNIKYKAMKKGLEMYGKNKAGITPINNIPSDADEYFANIDKAPEKKGAPAAKPETPAYDDVRALPDAVETRKPISITL